MAAIKQKTPNRDIKRHLRSAASVTAAVCMGLSIAGCDKSDDLPDGITMADIQSRIANSHQSNVPANRNDWTAKHDLEGANAFLRLNEYDISELQSKGYALMELGGYDEALGAYEKAVEREPKFAEGWIGKGKALQKLGRFEDSIAAFDTALGISEQDRDMVISNNYASFYYGITAVRIEGLYGKGIALEKLGRFDEALVSFNQLMTTYLPLDLPTVAWAHKGAVLESLGRTKEALEEYTHACGVDPFNASFKYHKGVDLEALGEHSKALRAFDMSLWLEPTNAEAWAHRGTLLYNLGKVDDALAAYSNALTIDPSNETALRVIGQSRK